MEPKEVDGIKFSLNYEEKELIFWRIFGELSEKGNESVDHDKLQERLISTAS